jgi:threonylcarbamoyladenosine tRNA methylthiotransferase MtaB
MPQLPGNVVKARAARLRELGAAMLASHLMTLRGLEMELLVEQDTMARSPGFAPVKLAAAQPTGALVRARIVSADQRFAYAEAA